MRSILPVANLVALMATIVVNYLSNTTLLNGETVAKVSDLYPTLITPASYAFSIWSLIYVGLVCFVFYQLRSKPGTEVVVEQVNWWFVISCIANSCWVMAWIYGYTELSVLIMLVLLSCLLKIVARTGMELTDAPWRLIFFVWWPFCLYLGWITMAAAVNVAAWLVSIGWNGWGISAGVWAVILVIVAGTIYLLLTWRRNMREAAMVGVWALIAVGVADRVRAPVVSIVAYGVAGVLALSAFGHAYRNRKTSPFRKRAGEL